MCASYWYHKWSPRFGHSRRKMVSISWQEPHASRSARWSSALRPFALSLWNVQQICLWNFFMTCLWNVQRLRQQTRGPIIVPSSVFGVSLHAVHFGGLHSFAMDFTVVQLAKILWAMQSSMSNVLVVVTGCSGMLLGTDILWHSNSNIPYFLNSGCCWNI